MKDNLTHPKDQPADDLIVIADECGDSMWDAVLRQEVFAQDHILLYLFFMRMLH